MRLRRFTDLLRRRAPAVGYHDVAVLRPAIRRAALLRLVCGGGALALVVAAALHARGLDASAPGLVPSGTTAVAVVDLSLSIEDAQYRLVRDAFDRLIEENASIGLVVFSDVPYELLPPGTPASELVPILRLLVPAKRGPPVNPWNEGFRSGTRVSAALDLARRMLERDRVPSGSILLVSDLETAPDDVPALTRTIEAIRASAIQLRAIGIAPSTDAQLIFEGVLQTGAFDTRDGTPVSTEAAREQRTPLPTALLVLAALALLSLAAHEVFGGRLALSHPQPVGKQT